MTTYTVTAYINTGEDNFKGYTPKAPIALVDKYEIKADDPHGAAEGMFTVGNRMGCDIHGKQWPSDVRSLSVGDLIEVRQPHGYRTIAGGQEVTFLACASYRWDEVPEPVNPIIDMLDAGRHTSRGRS